MVEAVDGKSHMLQTQDSLVSISMSRVRQVS
jgi:hypothetical protein